MSAIKVDIESSTQAQLLKEECLESIPKRRQLENALLASFVIVFTITIVYLWINGLIYDLWGYGIFGIFIGIFLAGYFMDKRYSPDWAYYLLEIIREIKAVDTIKLSEFINKDQPFLGANLGNCEKFLKIAGKFIKEQVIEIVIRGPNIYLKGFEPPPEEEEEKDSNEEPI